MREREVERIFVWLIKIGLWAIPVLPLFISSSMLFPFITGKNFTFRIVTEIIFALWAGLAIARPDYRPRLTPLFKAVTILTGILFLADLLSPNPYRAFFSNYERMEGFMMLGHFYLYFVMLMSMLKTRRDWMTFFHVTLLASAAVSFIALQQKLGYRISLQGGFRVDSTIGNPTYLAAYLLFHIWLLTILIYQFWRRRWLTVLYFLLLLFELAILYFTATRGAVLALVATSIPFAAALIIFWPRLFPTLASSRKWAGAVLALILAVPLLFWSIRGTAFVRASPTLHRLTNYSLEETTIKSRFMIWKMSWRGFLERPILGWGQENYYLVFQKYYDPGLFAQEPWFDRSHNIIFDWLIHAGILGLLSYLAIFGTLFWRLFSGIRKLLIPTWHGLVLGGLFLSYFLQNLFVFDNFNTYFLFFAFLAYTEYLRSPQGFSPAPVKGAFPRPPRSPYLAAAFGIVLLVAVAIGGYFLHVKPILESRSLIEALQLRQLGRPTGEMVDQFKKALSYRSFGDTEVREQLSQIARETLERQDVPLEDKKRIAEFAIAELKEETAHPAKDVKHLLFLSMLLIRGAELNPVYIEEARRALEEAARVSPTKQLVYSIGFAQLHLARGDLNGAIEALRHAWELDKEFTQAGMNLWVLAVLANRADVVSAVREEISPALNPNNAQELYRVGLAYQQVGNFAQALEIYTRVVEFYPDNPKHRASYAALLANFGRIAEARLQVEEGMRLNPNFEKENGELVRLLKASEKPVKP